MYLVLTAFDGNSITSVDLSKPSESLNLNLIFWNFRIGSLGCGYQGSGLVCCPHLNDPLKAADGQKCGTPAVQGQGYDGVGSYPWVARIGFRSIIVVNLPVNSLADIFIMLQIH